MLSVACDPVRLLVYVEIFSRFCHARVARRHVARLPFLQPGREAPTYRERGLIHVKQQEVCEGIQEVRFWKRVGAGGTRDFNGSLKRRGNRSRHGTCTVVLVHRLFFFSAPSL